MNRLLLYQTNKSCWITNLDWLENIDIIPTRFVVVNITKEWQEALMELFTDDKQGFIRTINEELNENPLTIYSN